MKKVAATRSGMLDTQVGVMQGSFHMLADDGSGFDAPVAPFRLAVPGVLH